MTTSDAFQLMDVFSVPWSVFGNSVRPVVDGMRAFADRPTAPVTYVPEHYS